MKKLLKRKETTVFILTVLLTLAVALRAPMFITPGSLLNIVVDTCILIIVATGQLGVILIGGIDLSVGSTMALVGMAAAMLNQFNPGIPTWFFMPFSVLAGAALGAVGGILVGFGRLPPLIASLGMMSAYRGIVFLLSKGQWVTANEMTEGFRKIPEGLSLGLPHMFWAALAVTVLVHIFMRHTRSGRDVYAIGGNPTAARFAGVSQRKVEVNVFVISGALAGLAGLLYVSRYGIAQNETATGFEMQTVAAAVLGGVNIAGGSGCVAGVVIGSLFLGVVNNALPVLRMSPFLQMAIQGFIILSAVVANTIVDQRNKKAFAAGRAR
jgi:rhamnose transport system permease protein